MPSDCQTIPSTANQSAFLRSVSLLRPDIIRPCKIMTICRKDFSNFGLCLSINAKGGISVVTDFLKV